MRKYFALLYVTFSVMSFAQFSDNVFDQDRAGEARPAPNLTAPAPAQTIPTMAPVEEVSAENSTGVPGPGQHEEGPGNPGEPVPVDAYLPLLLLSAVALIFYYQKKNRKINI
ncbi:MAG: hypothetical protein L6262_00070 [Weeksellaceae bacterium]|nr:hypothetical protein [Weeksellaceae bacterium]